MFYEKEKKKTTRLNFLNREQSKQ